MIPVLLPDAAATYLKQGINRWLVHGSRGEQLLWLLGLALLLIGAGYGLRDPWPADEPRYALVGKEMVDTGRWLFPHVAGVLYPDKPPLFFWLQASLYGLFGSVRWTFQLPSMLAGLATLLLVYDLGTRLWRRAVGAIAALLLLACFQFVLQAKSAQIDAVVTLWITLGMYGLLRHLLLGPQWRWYLIACAAMGAGVITKGVGFLPLFVFLPWGLARYRQLRLPSLQGGSWRWALGLLAFGAVTLAWLLPMLYEVMTSSDAAMQAYRDDILLKQTGERYADSWHHLNPAWYYLVNVIPLFWFPLSILLPWLLPAWSRRLRRGDARYLLLLGWVVLVLLFFSFSPGKRGVYILPALPMLALAAAPLLPGLLHRRGVQRALFWTMLLVSLSFIGMLLYYTIFRGGELQLLLDGYGMRQSWIFLLLLGGGGVAMLLLLHRQLPLAVGGAIAWTWLLLSLLGFPLLDPVRSPAGLMADVRARAEGSPLGMAGWKEQMALHANRPFVHFGYRRDRNEELQDALAWLAAGDDRYLLYGDELPDTCIIKGQARMLGYRHEERWLLLQADDIEPGCRERFRQAEVRELYRVDFLEPYR